jgi:hypothetical protein
MAIRILTTLVVLTALSTHVFAGEADDIPTRPGWTLRNDIGTYNPSTLYEYINGAADAYLNYSFEELTVLEYENGEGASLVVERYVHKSPLHAFGIYRQEKPSNPDMLEAGHEAYLTDAFLFLWHQRSYWKAYSYSSGIDVKEVLTILAQKIAPYEPEAPSVEKAFSCFPDSGSFIPRDYMGYPFFTDALEVGYAQDEPTFILFCMRTDDGVETAGEYLKRCGVEEVPDTDIPLQVVDPYHGPVLFVWGPGYVAGLRGIDDPSQYESWLKTLRQNLKS